MQARIRRSLPMRQCTILAMAMLFAVVMLAATATVTKQGASMAIAASTSGSCSGGWLWKNSLTVSSNGSSVTYEAKLSGMAQGWYNGPGTGQLNVNRSWLPDRTVDQRPIRWSGGATMYGGSVSYSSMGARSGQTITLYGRATGTSTQETCRVTITLK